MCFSKEVSFVASALLAIAGAVSISITSKRRQWRFTPFAIIPLLFAIQQLSEGFVWWSIEKNNQIAIHTFSLIYLFFAFFFWSFWVPFSLYFIEKKRHLLFSIFTIYGALTGLGLFILYLWNAEPLRAHVVNHSVCYSNYISIPKCIGLILYLFATVIPPLFSSRIKIKLLGATIALFAIISYFINDFAFISLWCFFSALISLLIILITYRETELSI